VLNDDFAKCRKKEGVCQARVNDWLDAGEAIFAIGECRGTYKATGRSMKAVFAGKLL